MKAIKFPQATHNIAENQDEYATLPSAVIREEIGPNREVDVNISCFELSDDEVNRIIKYRKLWHRALTFGQPLQPFNIFAVEDYFRYVEDNPIPEPQEYVDTHKIQIKMGFWQRMWFLFKGKEYVRIKIDARTSDPTNLVIILTQD